MDADVVVVAASRNEGCLDTVPLGQLEADDSAVYPKQKIQVGGLDVDVPDADLGIERARVIGGVHALPPLPDSAEGRVKV
jgi:hypothetical protein